MSGRSFPLAKHVTPTHRAQHLYARLLHVPFGTQSLQHVEARTCRAMPTCRCAGLACEVKSNPVRPSRQKKAPSAKLVHIIEGNGCHGEPSMQLRGGHVKIHGTGSQPRRLQTLEPLNAAWLWPRTGSRCGIQRAMAMFVGHLLYE